MTTSKSKFSQMLAVEVAGGVSIKNAAKKIGCSEQTAYNFSSDPGFQKQVAAIRTAAVASAVGKLSRASARAVDTLVAMLAASNTPKDRMAASKAILAALLPLTEFAELRSRIDALEQNKLRIAK